MDNKERKTALLVTGQDRESLAEILDECGAEVLKVRTCREARLVLRTNPQVDVVVSALSLDDGSWWTIRKELIKKASPATLTVCLPRAEAGVTDVLKAGCSALLVPPYNRKRVHRIVEAVPRPAASLA